jgi:hypothetical protein
LVEASGRGGLPSRKHITGRRLLEIFEMLFAVMSTSDSIATFNDENHGGKSTVRNQTENQIASTKRR